MREALVAAQGIPFTFSMAAGRLASLHADQRRFDEAAVFAAQALASGTGLSDYEARLVEAEVALGRAEPHAFRLAADALATAERGGYRASASRDRLERIIEGAGEPDDAAMGDVR